MPDTPRRPSPFRKKRKYEGIIVPEAKLDPNQVVDLRGLSPKNALAVQIGNALGKRIKREVVAQPKGGFKRPKPQTPRKPPSPPKPTTPRTRGGGSTRRKAS
jgi:hypothetical protein